jgi:hypothetical protein
MLKEL